MTVTQILIYLHATLGGIALILGGVALAVKKGSKPHKKSGLFFFYFMLASAFTALIISFLPGHESPFLFTIGVFSSYFLLTGYFALKYKRPSYNLIIDKITSVLMLMTGFGMILYPVYFNHKINIILTIFGIVGIIFASRDMLIYRNQSKLKTSWLKLHLGKMIGGYIAAVTAFIVVNNVFPPLIGWLGPGVLGGFYIAYWIRKINNTQKPNSKEKSI